MNAIIVLAAEGATAVGGLGVVAYLLHRDRGVCFRPGDPLPDIPADAPIRHLAARIDQRRRACNPGAPMVRH